MKPPAPEPRRGLRQPPEQRQPPASWPPPPTTVLNINGDHARVLHMDLNLACHSAAPTAEFSREKVDHLSRNEVYNKIFDMVVPKGPVAPPAGASELAEPDPRYLHDLCGRLITHAAIMIYSDPAHPGNITCYLPKKSDNSAMVHGTFGWTLQPVNMVFPPMLQRSIDLLFGNQPVPGEDGYPRRHDHPRVQAVTQLMRHIADNEQEFLRDAETMRPVLVRNADLVSRIRAACGRERPRLASLMKASRARLAPGAASGSPPGT